MAMKVPAGSVIPFENVKSLRILRIGPALEGQHKNTMVNMHALLTHSQSHHSRRLLDEAIQLRELVHCSLAPSIFLQRGFYFLSERANIFRVRGEIVEGIRAVLSQVTRGMRRRRKQDPTIEDVWMAAKLRNSSLRTMASTSLSFSVPISNNQDIKSFLPSYRVSDHHSQTREKTGTDFPGPVEPSSSLWRRSRMMGPINLFALFMVEGTFETNFAKSLETISRI
jgi:hypothetical protein